MTMNGGLAAFILLTTMGVIHTLQIPDKIPLTEAELSQTVNLTCNVPGFDNGLFFWYKINYGHMVQTVAGGSFDKVDPAQHFPNSRFQTKKVKDMYCLIIKNVSKEDEGTYLCQAGSAYKMTFVNGTNLVVKDSQNKKSFYVKQTSDGKSVLPGTEVTLQCSLLPEKKEKESADECAAEHDVFWFRAKSESNPGFIYATKTRCGKQAGSSCEYRLSIRNSSDTGTYYCAVVTCGEILFGEGTKVETRKCLGEELFLYAIVLLGGLLVCSVLVNITFTFQRRKPKPHRENHKDKEDTAVTNITELDEDQPCDVQDGEEDGLNYVALNFSSRKPTRWKSKRETSDNCTYSNIKLSVKGSIHQRDNIK